MGRNLVLNMADHGFAAAGYDKDQVKVEELCKESPERNICAAADIKEFIALLRKPRAIIMLVPAGAPVDWVIKDLLPYLEKDDLIIDAGNSYFKDTRGREPRCVDRRTRQRAGQRLIASVQLIKAIGGGWTERQLFASVALVNFPASFKK
jgi:6-phosphogluconate dehydrogenase